MPAEQERMADPMKRMSRICVLLAALLLLGGCNMSAEQFAGLVGTDATQTVTQPVESLKIAFSAKLPLDPFEKSSSTNAQVSRLCFEPLFALDEQMRTFGLLAQGVEKVSDTEYLITLNAQRVFWDGSPLQAEDVLYSFIKAQASENYKTLLTGIVGMTEENGKIKVSLVAPDVFFMNNLSFPVIKKGSDTKVELANPKEASQIDKLKINEIGTGLYQPVFGKSVTLELNSRHPRASKATVKTISLVDMPDFEAMSYSLDAGVVDMIFSDLAGGLLPVVSGNLRATSQNHLVYLGVSATGATADPAVRKAISIALDRSKIIAYFSGYAKEATTPFHPDWAATATLGCSNLTYQADAAKTAVAGLNAAGLNSVLTLAVNSDNELRVRIANEVAAQLSAAGFSCTVTPLAFAAYSSAVSNGGYNLYIGELKMPDNFSMSYLLKSGQRSFGVTASEPLMTALNGFYQTGDPAAFLTVFNEELPFLPLCYRSGLAGFSAGFVVPEETTFGFAYSDIEQTARTIKVAVSDETSSAAQESAESE